MRLGGKRARVVVCLADAAGSASSRTDSRADRRRCASTKRDGDRRRWISRRRSRPVCTRSTTRSFDRDGNLYVTYSGTRGQEVPVSIFRVRPERHARNVFVRHREPDVDGDRCRTAGCTSRAASRAPCIACADDGSVEPFATDLGVACGLAFDPDGTLFVGDRSGTIFRVDRDGQATTFASLPSSVAAFHLALGPDGALYVTAPDAVVVRRVYRIARGRRRSTTRYAGFGRPQGIAFDAARRRCTSSRRWRASADCIGLPATGAPELVLRGPGLVGVAFGPAGGIVVCSNDTAYRLCRPAEAGRDYGLEAGARTV